MALRVMVDIDHESQEISIRRHLDAPEWPLKQSISAPIDFVERPSIRVEEVRESLARCFWSAIAGSDEQVKVVMQQAVRVGLGDGRDMSAVEVQEITIVAILTEQIGAIITT